MAAVNLQHVGFMHSDKFLVCMEETAAPQSILGESRHFRIHGVVCQAFVFLSVDHVLGVSSVAEWLNSHSLLHDLDWCRPHGSCDNPEGLVLDPVQSLKMCLGCSGPR